MTPFVDQRLRERLDKKAADELDQWCVQSENSFTLDHWLTNGLSTAAVAAVLERHPHRGAELVIMKADRATGEPRPGEFARHDDALHHVKAFAELHLAQRVREPVSGGNGWWFVFQRVAGGSLSDLVTLQTVLRAVLHPSRDRHGSRLVAGNGQGSSFPPAQTRSYSLPSADAAMFAATFADASATVVSSTLNDWAGRPQVEFLDVPMILHRQLGHRAAPNGAVTKLAQAHPGPTLVCEDEDQALPNPFSLVFDTDRYRDIQLPTFIGRAHGDLHIENILVPASLHNIAASYQLIDLARYSTDAVLTRDPTHLVLHVLARTLNELGPTGRTAAIDMLLDPRDEGVRLPTWLATFISETRKAGENWARQASLVDHWRDQIPLSLLACALTCAVRPSTRPEDRGWFLRLAANAAAVIFGQHIPAGVGTPTATTTPPATATSSATAARPATLAPSATATPSSGPASSATVAPPTAPPTAPSAAAEAAPRSTGDSARRSRSQPASDIDMVISYAPTDESWATWIHYHLVKAGWRVADLDPTRAHGQSRSQAGSTQTRTLVVVSRAHPLPATGTTHDLVVVQVEETQPSASAIDIDMVDLAGLGESEARTTLLTRISAIFPR
ncbi:toll/interleukin-1 receptor domain-containing protein [Frankia sp. R82]|uniref:toll/interleukin-1 receptor domain-containing protein n=1 Tax=Frankia sp. R82 TaxID=2950553 RepID=UPI002042FC56|nr:toll/interleukin-1 receptor domain-containing protein [Frankia sp. R82]MCM3883316.1 toll/interleukin-1 receptor domain-containing protein [Frankia sp. R82]